MKVIVYNYSDKTARGICCGCKSVLEISREDVKYDSDRDPYITCPLCKKSTHLSYNTIKTLMV